MTRYLASLLLLGSVRVPHFPATRSKTRISSGLGTSVRQAGPPRSCEKGFMASVAAMHKHDKSISPECSQTHGVKMVNALRETTNSACAGEGVQSTVLYHKRKPFDTPRYAVEMKNVRISRAGVQAPGCQTSAWLQSAKLGVTERAVFKDGDINGAALPDCTACSVRHKALIQLPWDYNNFYEWYGDWVTLWETLAMLQWDPDDVEAFLDAPSLEKLRKRPFGEAWSMAFKKRGVRVAPRDVLFDSVGCCFSHVATVPHGGLSTLTALGGRGGRVQCASPTIMASAKYLEDLADPNACKARPANRATLLVREGGARAFDDDAEAERAVRKALPAGWTLEVVKLAEVHTLAAQIAKVSSSRLLVGVHGAGMMLGLFLPPKAQVVEIFCGDRSGWGNHHYMNLETMADTKASEGKLYHSSDGGGCRVDASAVEQAVEQAIGGAIQSGAEPAQ
eukprot:CAMPEP_0198537728 /NCGR_PEP_ID=MMETSP1462-20131121/44844_1 /TAXON_ID=1333877 /ORGANISM="Brandtodinium nutriculum, Strain RCC3387" /LENGTH=449 /DNA_ID=CAMNT_0044267727 /DNA_START=108 /DNA_END=1457 /DNA_ORIENTATION=-